MMLVYYVQYLPGGIRIQGEIEHPTHFIILYTNLNSPRLINIYFFVYKVLHIQIDQLCLFTGIWMLTDMAKEEKYIKLYFQQGNELLCVAKFGEDADSYKLNIPYKLFGWQRISNRFNTVLIDGF